jgi:putative major outer membrane protein
MKKLLGLLALTLVTSGVARADQDVLKSINVSTEYRQNYQDKTGDDANGIGFAGFKKDNRGRTRVRNIFSGKIGLVDEGGWDLTFWTRWDKDQHRNRFNGQNITQYGTYRKTDRIYSKLGLEKKLTDDVKVKIRWQNDTYRTKDLTTKEISTTGIGNEFAVGPTFNKKIWGQNVTLAVEGVYFGLKGNRRGEYYLSGNDFKDSKVNGWGLNADLEVSSNITKGNWGSLDYYASFNHHYRDTNKTQKNGKKGKPSVYQDYYTSLSYTTPSVAGIYGKVVLENEFERYPRYYWENMFDVITEAGYKKSFETGTGKVSLNPFVRYRPYFRDSYKESGKDRKTADTNEVRFGLTVGYSAN